MLTPSDVLFLEKLAAGGFGKDQLHEINNALRRGVSQEQILRIFKNGISYERMIEINSIIDTLSKYNKETFLTYKE